MFVARNKFPHVKVARNKFPHVKVARNTEKVAGLL